MPSEVPYSLCRVQQATDTASLGDTLEVGGNRERLANSWQMRLKKTRRRVGLSIRLLQLEETIYCIEK